MTYALEPSQCASARALEWAQWSGPNMQSTRTLPFSTRIGWQRAAVVLILRIVEREWFFTYDDPPIIDILQTYKYLKTNYSRGYDKRENGWKCKSATASIFLLRDDHNHLTRVSLFHHVTFFLYYPTIFVSQRTNFIWTKIIFSDRFYETTWPTSVCFEKMINGRHLCN